VDERRRVLEMLRDGRISVEEAERLLDALDTGPAPGGAPPRFLRVQVSGHRGDKVDVALPLALADVAVRLLPKGLRLSLGGEELDVARLLADLRTGGAAGTLVDARSPTGDHVRISVE
jgi:hypothetical protein